MLMIRNIDLYVQIRGLSRTSTKIPGLSRPGNQIFKFQDFPSFQRPVRTLSDPSDNDTDDENNRSGKNRNSFKATNNY